MFELLKAPIDALFDKSISFIKKFFIFIILILGLFVLDQIFLFSHFYVSSNKIEMVGNIENIKFKTIPNYQVDSKLIELLSNMEISILNHKSVFSDLQEYIKKIQIGEISFNYLDYFGFFSLQFFWIIFGGIISIQVMKKGKNGIGEFFGLLIFLAIMMFLWNFIFNFLGSLFLLHDIGQILLNIILNILIIGLLAFSGRRKKN